MTKAWYRKPYDASAAHVWYLLSQRERLLRRAPALLRFPQVTHERKKEIRPGAWIRKPSQRLKAWGGATVGPKQTISLAVEGWCAEL